MEEDEETIRELEKQLKVCMHSRSKEYQAMVLAIDQICDESIKIPLYTRKNEVLNEMRMKEDQEQGF